MLCSKVAKIKKYCLKDLSKVHDIAMTNYLVQCLQVNNVFSSDDNGPVNFNRF